MRASLQSVLAEVQTLAPTELPQLLGELEEIRATALARLTTPAPQTQPDRYIDVKEAADRMGMSRHYLYRHWQKFKFARQEGRKVLFSSSGLDQYLKKSR